MGAIVPMLTRLSSLLTVFLENGAPISMKGPFIRAAGRSLRPRRPAYRRPPQSSPRCFFINWHGAHRFLFIKLGFFCRFSAFGPKNPELFFYRCLRRRYFALGNAQINLVLRSAFRIFDAILPRWRNRHVKVDVSKAFSSVLKPSQTLIFTEEIVAGRPPIRLSCIVCAFGAACAIQRFGVGCPCYYSVEGRRRPENSVGNTITRAFLWTFSVKKPCWIDLWSDFWLRAARRLRPSPIVGHGPNQFAERIPSSSAAFIRRSNATCCRFFLRAGSRSSGRSDGRFIGASSPK